MKLLFSLYEGELKMLRIPNRHTHDHRHLQFLKVRKITVERTLPYLIANSENNIPK
jgi:hypothetical protein